MYRKKFENDENDKTINNGISKMDFDESKDSLNSLFMSNKASDIIEFYNKFNFRKDLIEWMRKRPKGKARICEINGPNDIVVVIPTIDCNGAFAKICRDIIFSGFHIIFVESGTEKQYFNYAHNCNVGIRKALEYNPKWIIISNDDMKKKDEPEILRSEISKYDPKKYQILFAETSKNHSLEIHMGKLNAIGTMLLYASSLIPTSIVNSVTNNRYLAIAIRLKKFKYRYKISKKYGVKPFFFTTSKHWNIYMKEGRSFTLFQDFGVFSSSYLSDKKGGMLFDETFINAHEDQMISLELSQKEYTRGALHYSIESQGGGSFGDSLERALRTAASDIYLSLKMESCALRKR